MVVVWTVLQWVPAVIVVVGFATVWIMLYKESLRVKDEWDEEVKRRQKVKELYPAKPSYEERMGVKYGPKQDE